MEILKTTFILEWTEGMCFHVMRRSLDWVMVEFIMVGLKLVRSVGRPRCQLESCAKCQSSLLERSAFNYQKLWCHSTSIKEVITCSVDIVKWLCLMKSNTSFYFDKISDDTCLGTNLGYNNWGHVPTLRPSLASRSRCLCALHPYPSGC
jgi:hypothetical protein